MQTILMRSFLRSLLATCLFFWIGILSLSAQENPECLADAGTLSGLQVNLDEDVAGLLATPAGNQNVPEGYQQLFVLTSGEELIIEAVNQFPYFEVNPEGRYTIHTLIFNPETLDLSIVEFGVTTGFDVNGLIIQGGGEICASLDVAGAPFDVT
ncbi:MAG: hypothetical protein HRU40_14790, partial [Saprospiraceae bacterium]|nr:hypothetical protein [Saprospiraceae bacterium]